MGVEKSVRRLDSGLVKWADLGLSPVFLRVMMVFCTVFLTMIKSPQNNCEIQDQQNKQQKHHNQDK